MAAAEAITFPHFGRTLHIVALAGVTPAGARAAVAAAKDAGALALDAALLASPFVLRAAAHRALSAHANGVGRVANLNVETVAALHGGRNVGEALRVLGAHDAATSLVLGAFDAPEAVAALAARVEGTRVPLDVLCRSADVARVMAAFKLAPEDCAVGGVEDAVVLRGALQID